MSLYKDYIAEMKSDVESVFEDWLAYYVKNGKISPKDIAGEAFTDKNSDVYDVLHSDLFDDDSVTGNASGSYFMSTSEAEERLIHAWSDENIKFALKGIGSTLGEEMEYGTESADSVIRCVLLSDVLNEMFDSGELQKLAEDYAEKAGLGLKRDHDILDELDSRGDKAMQASDALANVGQSIPVPPLDR